MILAVCGGKGGVGKSTVATNLGAELDAAVVDAGATTGIRVDGPDLHDVLAGRADLAAALVERDGVAVLPCDRRPTGARSVALDALGPVFDRLDRRHGTVVLDCPPGLAVDVGYALYSAAASVLVTTPDRAALSAALRTRELARGVEAPVVAAVLNAAGPGDGRVAERLERQVGAPTTLVRRREEIDRAGATPVRAVAPDSPAVETFAALAETVEASKRGVRDRLENG